MKIRIYKFLTRTRVEGPGERACIWVQGCPIRCPGCALPDTWPFEGGHDVDVEELAGAVLNESHIEGVTFVGGEPFEQAEALAQLGSVMQKHGLSVVTFTGYLFEMINKYDRPGWRELLSVTDLLIDGQYIKELSDLSRPWVGSLNQRYHFLTPRYKALQQDLSKILNRIEVRIGSNGEIYVNGMADIKNINQLFTSIND
ncbi:4Fe-4S single cluster domain-containing protein [Pelotomaculum propionicicum]|uniref:4Fe-4S single cluster domain-containing protein n=1 Tax=Pelotomaculum propionicicum TaxID=258475 RepID=UPI003B81B8EB